MASLKPHVDRHRIPARHDRQSAADGDSGILFTPAAEGVVQQVWEPRWDRGRIIGVDVRPTGSDLVTVDQCLLGGGTRRYPAVFIGGPVFGPQQSQRTGKGGKGRLVLFGLDRNLAKCQQLASCSLNGVWWRRGEGGWYSPARGRQRRVVASGRVNAAGIRGAKRRNGGREDGPGWTGGPAARRTSLAAPSRKIARPPSCHRPAGRGNCVAPSGLAAFAV